MATGKRRSAQWFWQAIINGTIFEKRVDVKLEQGVVAVDDIDGNFAG